jgi:hypothetical protein
MCSACENKPIEPHVPVDPELIHRAREVEGLMSGERVPDVAWEIYFGLAGGSVEYRHFQRMYQALAQAEQSQVRLRRGLRRVAAPSMHSAYEQAERSR